MSRRLEWRSLEGLSHQHVGDSSVPSAPREEQRSSWRNAAAFFAAGVIKPTGFY